MREVSVCVLFLFSCFIVSYGLEELVFKTISNSNWFKENYKGIKIPNSMGICFIFFFLL